MNQQRIMILSILIAGILLGGISVYAYYHHVEKHTGPVTVAFCNQALGCVLFRGNNEAFVMKFDQEIMFAPSAKFRDIVYTDVSRTIRHLEKVQQ
jgi:hypothetical protein